MISAEDGTLCVPWVYTRGRGFLWIQKWPVPQGGETMKAGQIWTGHSLKQCELKAKSWKPKWLAAGFPLELGQDGLRNGLWGLWATGLGLGAWLWLSHSRWLRPRRGSQPPPGPGRGLCSREPCSSSSQEVPLVKPVLLLATGREVRKDSVAGKRRSQVTYLVTFNEHWDL